MSASDELLILDGWHRVKEGSAIAGDRYWDMGLRVWLPVCVNEGRTVSEFLAVIRKDVS